MKSIKAQIRERVIEAQQDAQQYKVFKYRNVDDDGWVFMVAKSKADACSGLSHCAVFPANRGDLEQIAVRALRGMG
jgi:hypothetical protein